MVGLIEKSRKRRKLLLRELNDIMSQLRGSGAKKVVLFGSLVSGNVWSGSDIDLLVVMPSSKSGKMWRKELKIDRNVALDLLVFSEEELEEELKINRLVKKIMEEGVVLYEERG